MITALCGGVGGSKLALGLYRSLAPYDFTIVVNTADDLDFAGLHVSPDLDTVTYTLAGIAGPHGWGITDDTFQAIQMLDLYGVPSWFQVGDRDLATDVFRTWLLHTGRTLTEVTRQISGALGVRATVLPMTDSPVATQLLVEEEWIDFQEYFVRRRHRARVEAVRYGGIENAQATEPVLAAIKAAEAIVIVNSNPVLSILPITCLPSISALLRNAKVPRVAVSPIIGTDAVSGPAGDLMRLVNEPASAAGVASLYRALIDGIVIDRQDVAQVPAIEALGVKVLVTDCLMRDEADRSRLAVETLAFARTLS